MSSLPKISQLKRAVIHSGYQITLYPAHTLERWALDAGPYEAKRHEASHIMGLILPDKDTIGITKTLPPLERAETLVHELIHLVDETLPEEAVEEHTKTLWQSMSQADRGFFTFLVS